jgi:exodeoxyribonuclease VII small subunit
VAKSAEKAPSFEEDLACVEDAIRKLERGEIPLEDSIDLYAVAMRHLGRCHEVLSRAEKRLEIVRSAAEGAVPAELREGDGVVPKGP